jgi:hypothetical protein
MINFGCDNSDYYQFPPYGIIKRFSNRIQPKTGLVLTGLRANHGLTDEHKQKYGKANFYFGYKLIKNRDDTITENEARCLLVSVAESFLKEVNSDPSMKDYTDNFPINYNFTDIIIWFVDHEGIELGSGIANIMLHNGTIRYETYKIREYRRNGPMPSSIGEHSVILAEPYPEALDIVKNQNCLMKL